MICGNGKVRGEVAEGRARARPADAAKGGRSARARASFGIL